MESLEGQHGPLFKDDMHKTFCACFHLWLKKNLAAVRWRLTWFRNNI